MPPDWRLGDNLDDFLDDLGDDLDIDEDGIVDELPDHIAGEIAEIEEEENARPTPDVSQQKGQDYRLTGTELRNLGGPKTRARRNLKAIRIAKRLIEEKRPATREEQDTLARFVGWGGISNLFASWNRDFDPERKELKELLTDAEYNTASESTQWAHYTALEVVEAMYAALEHMGVKPTDTVEALEPSAGTGNFIGMAPFRGRWTAVEKDKMTGAILQGLYPNIRSEVGEFQKVDRDPDTEIPPETFDIVVGNPPFSGRVQFPYGGRKHSIHNYFFLQSLDKLRPGGLLAMVTSTGTLDVGTDHSRKAMAAKADFLGAIRLPRTAFQENAATQVTTDIIFFQKRAEGAEPNHAGDWMRQVVVDHDMNVIPPQTNKAGTVTGPPQGGYHINEYYVANPHMMLGTITRDTSVPFKDTGSQTQRSAVNPHEDQEIGAAIAEATANLPQDIYRPLWGRPDEDGDVADDPAAVRGLKPGQWAIRSRKKQKTILRREGQKLVPVKHPKNAYARLSALVGIADAAREVQKQNRELESDADLAKAQKALAKLYDPFVKKYGAVNKIVVKTRTKALGKDVEEGTRVQIKKTGAWAEIAEVGTGADVTVVTEEDGREVFLKKGDLRIEYEYVDHVNLKYYDDQTSLSTLYSLDRYDPKSGQYVKSDIFTKRLTRAPNPPKKIESAWEGVIRSLVETARVDMAVIKRLTGMTEKQIRQEVEGEQIFHDPDTGQYVLASVYLAGNVREKLAIAEEKAKHSPRYKLNVEKLKEVQPERISGATVRKAGGFDIGSTWFSPTRYREFARQVLGVNVTVEMRKTDARFSVRLKKPDSYSDAVENKAAYQEHSVPDFHNYSRSNNGSAHRILAALLNNQEVVVTQSQGKGKPAVVVQDATSAAKDIAEKMQGAFEQWALHDNADRSVELVDEWNANMNHTVPKTFDGQFLQGEFRGLAESFRGEDFAFNPHQLDAIWRGVSDGNTLLQHATGTGKTFIIAGLTMMAKQMGLARKPLIVVPNAILEQFSGEFLEIFPSANLLTADKAKLERANRQRFLADIQGYDWDAVIMAQSHFDRLETTPQSTADVLDDLVSEFRQVLEEANEDPDASDFTIKEIEKKIAAWEQEIDGLLAKKVDKEALYFEDLGLDMMLVDEAHAYKNLELPTFNVKNVNSSARAFRMYLATRMIEKANPGRGVFFSTATPISNDMGELYKMLRYIDEPWLRREGYPSLDAFSKQYVAFYEDWDFNDIGQLVRKYAPRRFKNVYSLRMLWEGKVDVIQNRDLDLAVPDIVDENGEKTGKPTEIVVSHPSGQADPRLMKLSLHSLERWKFIQAIGQKLARAMGLSFFSVMWDNRKASLDARLVTSIHATHNISTMPLRHGHRDRVFDNSQPFNRAKVEVATERIVKFLDETKDVRATAMVFAEFGVQPNGYMGFGLYNELRRRLIEEGDPRGTRSPSSAMPRTTRC